MCLILFAWRSHPQHKLLVAANRDEFYARPASAATFWDEAPHILAGRDLEQGGSWLGITRDCRFAAVTNVRNPAAPQGSRSRGFLVSDFLTSNDNPEHFGAALQSTLKEYSPFNLLAGDGEQLYYGNSNGDWRELQPGIYGLSNATLDTPWPKVVEGKQLLIEAMMTDPEEESLFALLANRKPADTDALPETGINRDMEKRLSSRFIQLDGYGTRSSTLLLQSYNNRMKFVEKQFDQTGTESAIHRYTL